MSDEDADEFTAAECTALRARYVIDRVDGRPLLMGFARCPRCAVRLRVDPRGRIDLEDKLMRIHFRLHCMACGRALSITEGFDG